MSNTPRVTVLHIPAPIAGSQPPMMLTTAQGFEEMNAGIGADTGAMLNVSEFFDGFFSKDDGDLSLHLWMDEDAFTKDLPVNSIASFIAQTTILGDVMLVAETLEEDVVGDIDSVPTDLPKNVLDAVSASYNHPPSN